MQRPASGRALIWLRFAAYARAPPFSTAGQSFTQTQFAPSRGRGLKQRSEGNLLVELLVRPLTGARIETRSSRATPSCASVRPLTGARIETRAPRPRPPARARARPLTGARIETTFCSR